MRPTLALHPSDSSCAPPRLKRPFVKNAAGQTRGQPISRFSSPNVFQVEAVDEEGSWEWGYAAGQDAYVHTSWLAGAGQEGGMAVRRGFWSGLCGGSNLHRVRGDLATGDEDGPEGVAEGGLGGGTGRAMDTWGETGKKREQSGEMEGNSEGEEGEGFPSTGGRTVELIGKEPGDKVNDDGPTPIRKSSVQKAHGRIGGGACVCPQDDQGDPGAAVWGFVIDQYYQAVYSDRCDPCLISNLFPSYNAPKPIMHHQQKNCFQLNTFGI